MVAKFHEKWGEAYVYLAHPKRRGMSVYEALMLMLAFATLIIRIIDNNEHKK